MIPIHMKINISWFTVSYISMILCIFNKRSTVPLKISVVSLFAAMGSFILCIVWMGI